MIENLKSENYDCNFDQEEGLLLITYRNTITPTVTRAVYAWITEVIDRGAELPPIYGCIFNFSDVKAFDSANLSTARRESRNLRQEKSEAIEAIPTLLIAVSTYQEMMLRTSMKLAQQSEQQDMPRVRVVRSMQDAYSYIEQWHAFHGRNVILPRKTAELDTATPDSPG
ncbi:MAG TPA: hypothetical protein VJZ27_14225 [Aggregatilineales bacterium]|nr:hypothetical protein [Aggregatilineales bacterium]